MSKDYSNCPVINDMMGEIKENARQDLISKTRIFAVIGIICFVIFLIMGSADIAITMLIVFLLAWLYFPIKYLRTDKPLKVIKAQLKLNSNDELESLLERSRKISKYLFVTDKYILNFVSNFDNTNAIDLENIKSVKASTFHDEDGKPIYRLKMKMKKGESKYLSFENESEQRTVCKIIDDAAAIAQNSKYIN